MPLLVQVLVWGLLVVVLFKRPPGAESATPPWLLGRQGVLLGLLLAAYYLSTLVLVPRWLLRGHATRYAVVAVGLVLLIGVGSWYVNSWLFPPPAAPRWGHEWPRPGYDGLRRPPRPAFGRPPPPRGGGRGGGGDFDTILLLTAVLVLATGAGLGVATKWQADAEARQQLEQEKATTELALLKAQLNPHFFFNTLNNIYALTLLDGERARQALVQLSRLMRSVLYEGETGTARLGQELDFLRDYVDLMQLRLVPTATVELALPLLPLAPDPPFAPLLLLPFVENAFKHGVSAEAPCRVLIRVAQPTPDTVELEVVNTRFDVRAASLETSNGIGLTNTRRRLALLYPDRHELTIGPRDTPHGAEFRVWLRIRV